VFGKVTFNILERTVSLDATATVKVIQEQEEEVVKTWTVEGEEVG
jgi:hypothetical protein